MTQGLKIASGWNVVLGSLTDIATISVSGQLFTDPRTIPLYDPGLREYRTDGTPDDTGFADQVWEFGFMFFAQYDYLKSTYCSGGFYGKVTIYTTLGSVAFSRMNAIMVVPKPTELKPQLTWYPKVPLKFLRLVASS